MTRTFIVGAATTRPEALGLPFTRVEPAQAGCLSGRQPDQGGQDQRRAAPPDPGGSGRDVSAHQDLEGVQRPRARRQAGTASRRSLGLSRSGVSPSTSRAADDPPRRRGGVALAGRPPLIAANYHKVHGVRQFHGCYSIGEDVLWGVVRQRKSAANTLAALKSIRARPATASGSYVILDNLSAHKGRAVRQWARRQQSRVVLHPDLQLLGQPDRSALRAAARVRAQQLPAPQPHSVDPSAARLPALAQRQRPRPRPARRATPRTRPNPSRERPPLGPTTPTSSMKHHRNDTRANVCGHRTSCTRALPVGASSVTPAPCIAGWVHSAARRVVLPVPAGPTSTANLAAESSSSAAAFSFRAWDSARLRRLGHRAARPEQFPSRPRPYGASSWRRASVPRC